jgi:hypothetical protein
MAKKSEDTPEEAGDILLMWRGPEHVRELQRSDLGVYPESETLLSWNPENNHISPVGLTEDEVQVLARGGGNWALVTEEFLASLEVEQKVEPVELPVAQPIETQEENPAAQVDVIDESASEQADS